MYEPGGTIYVYLCYGIHHLFNIVTNTAGIPHAVLIRAIQPLDGIDIMLKRRNLKEISFRLTTGPGILSQAMGITVDISGQSLLDEYIWIEKRDDTKIENVKIISRPRVGIQYAGEDILNPWRFQIEGNPWISFAN